VRLAFVSPLPPAPTGIADHAVELLALLAGRHEIEVFHAQEAVDAVRLPDRTPVRPAAELVERHRDRRYDLAVYQMGNGPAHAFLYDLLSRVPGLLVLHDLVLYHSRAAHFLEADAVRAWRRDPASARAHEAARPALDAWRQELGYSYPARGDRLFETHLGTVGELLPYAYPLFRIPVEASRAVLVSNSFMARAVLEEVPGAEVMQAPLPATRDAVEAGAVQATRRRLGFGPGDVVVGCYGLLTPEKRIETVARAVSLAALRDGRLRLLLAGPVPDAAGLESLLVRLGARGRTVITGRLPFDELPAHIEAADVVVHLRYPTGRETSAALLRVLAQGRPTIVADLENQRELPGDAVLRVDLADETGGTTRAILRLASSSTLRARLGERAAAFVSRENGPERVLQAWEHALARASRRPMPPPREWPAHWPRPPGATQGAA
jgi:glycosyltransferase involved in cell wall biosynthesis